MAATNPITDNTTGTISHGSTIFVSNLAFTTTTESLRAAFDDLAPVRSCFVVYEKSNVSSEAATAEPPASEPKSKGVGYVTFALKEDAESIVAKYAPNADDVTGERLVVDERKIRIGWPDKKSIPQEGHAKRSIEKKIPVRASAVEKDSNANRTLIISNVAHTGMTKGMFWKKIRKCDGAESVVWPVDGDNTRAYAIFGTPSAAVAALPKLHLHVYKGSVLSVVLKKQADPMMTPSSNLHNRAGRLIVRNLPWSISEDDLLAYFAPHGTIHAIHIPASEPKDRVRNHEGGGVISSEQKRLSRGFAFVWFHSKKDAAEAIVKVNGTKMYGGYARDKAVMAANGTAGHKEMMKNEGNEKARVVAVDWAVGKDRWQEMQAERAPEEIDNGTEDKDEAEEITEDESDVTAPQDDPASSSLDIEGDDSVVIDEEESRPPQPEEGTTLFIRNVPFEATNEDLKELFRNFGSLRYARVTMDSETGRSRGTGFVCFWKLSDADACVEEAQRMRDDLDPELASKKNPFSLLTIDPSSSRVARLVLQGRALDVTRAVSREQAEKMREAGQRLREKEDSRNLYLMREGVIFASTPSAATVTNTELERRQQSWNARRALLRNNPSLYISRTRLSIRNLPLWVTERTLKRLAVHAKSSFEEEVSRGERAGLTTDELEEAADAAEKGSEVSKKPKNNGPKSSWVKQVKIIRQADRVDVLTGKGRSKGYGFLELGTHADALRVLRWANNNETANKLMWSWWKDELQELCEQQSKILRTSERKEGVDLETRVKKLKLRSEEMNLPGAVKEANVKDGRTLHIEFSVENVVVVKRRQGRQETTRRTANQIAGSEADLSKEPPKLSQKRKGRDESNEEIIESRKRKRGVDKTATKKHDDTSSPPEKSKPKDPTKAGTQVGRIIGKKRKERRKKAFNRV